MAVENDKLNIFLNNLRSRARNGYLRKIIFPEAADERVLEAASILKEEGIAIPILVCNSIDAIQVRASGLACIEIDEERTIALEKLLLELRSSKVGTKDELTAEEARKMAHDPLIYGMYLLHLGEGDGLVGGAVRTSAEVVRAGLWLVGKSEGIRTVSSSFYMIVPPFRGETQEVLTFADCAVVPNPTAEQLADIAIASSDARRTIVGDEPRVVFLSYSTKGSGGDGPSTALVRQALDLVRQRRNDIIVDGEMQADSALIKSISERKMPGNLVGGRANVLIFPSLDAANIAYKLVLCLLPGAHALGPILQGMARPMSDLSRGATADDIVNIATIVAVQSCNLHPAPSASSSRALRSDPGACGRTLDCFSPLAKTNTENC